MRLRFWLLLLAFPLLASPEALLKPREPHWRHKVLENHSSGAPARLLFYENFEGKAITPLKELSFYPSGKVKSETDLISVEEGSPGALLWKGTAVPHGVSIAFYEDGQIEKVTPYAFGLAEGEMKIYYP